jgi:GlpG protein
MSADDIDARPRVAWLTLSAIGLSALVWLVAQTGLIPPDFGAADPRGPHGGRWWLLFLTPWVHLQLWHLAFNAYWLWIFGTRIERALGSAALAAIMVMASLASGAAMAWWSGSTGHGASGVVYALFGFLVAQRKDPRYAPAVGPQVIALLLIWLVACMFTALPIAHAAHVGGLAVGVALGLVPSERWRIAGISATAVLVVAAMAVLLHPPHEPRPPASASS